MKRRDRRKIERLGPRGRVRRVQIERHNRGRRRYVDLVVFLNFIFSLFLTLWIEMAMDNVVYAQTMLVLLVAAFVLAIEETMVPHPVRAIEGEEEPCNGLFDTLK